ncbi:MerR family transcriptional regulator [Parasphaerochaeta coccoides]|uniref:Transcriptional regulator, MerR family n=1 Tax=Parasphaerochaeta coccoides (strain ATCC BAA-1237 / DSM 17374 / SPN1) TaxID=760011 RepID=F4GI23_PARC1|nr:MerR family transcriptional regulator [Parasphaerochaeta coccoides]AEC02621.1 transcriptional regulator, MerR family [Parasphaerochaeta coccoides DSM 17374]
MLHDTTGNMEDGKYRIGELARKAKVTVRTVRYYESLGLLKTQARTGGGQRFYTDADLVYLRRLLQLKALDFSLEDIGRIIRMGAEDVTGEKRRVALLKQYRGKLSDAMEKRLDLDRRIDELEWHVRQLSSVGVAFQQCPGSACAGCEFSDRCMFFRDDED